MENKEKCKHLNFEANVNVFRILQNEEDKIPIYYNTELRVCCRDCKMDFEFVGIPAGMSQSQPMSNVDFTMARLPMIPSSGNMATKLNYTFNEKKDIKNDFN